MTSDESYGALANQLVLRSESKLSMDLETLLPYDGPLIRYMLQEQKDLGNGVKVGHASWPWMDKPAPLAGRDSRLRAQIVGLLCAPHARSPPALLALLTTREGPWGGHLLWGPVPPASSSHLATHEALGGAGVSRAGLSSLMPPTSVLHLAAHKALGGRVSHRQWCCAQSGALACSMLELFEAIHLDDLTTDFVPNNHAVPRASRRATRSTSW
ncbi:hypothetical protein GGX14DRAFT_553920 [Mycena pura]|uniref:Uncharacterized protein n=1 Tax=Mycena pura TaxID=153505 RepID=A0AAD6YV89_9AGAR|nr:hypothetical protein GGX14DRAFT_553920 [Mycena pura]